jgi:hypothetical protein
LLAAVLAGAFIGFGSKGTVYQDIQWGINVQKHLTILKADSNNVTDAVNKSDYSTLAISAQYIIDHTDKAIEENDQYEVSPKFQEAQKEWRMGLQDYNSSGRYLLQGATEGKSGGTGIENFQTAAQMTSSGTAHLKKASESLGINIPINLSLKELIIKIFLASL